MHVSPKGREFKLIQRALAPVSVWQVLVPDEPSNFLAVTPIQRAVADQLIATLGALQSKRDVAVRFRIGPDRKPSLLAQRRKIGHYNLEPPNRPILITDGEEHLPLS